MPAIRKLLPVLALLAAAGPAAAGGDILWTHVKEVTRNGPLTVNLRDKASLRVPSGYRFVPEAKLPEFHELAKDGTAGDEAGILFMDNDPWDVIITFPADDPLAGLDAKQLDTDEAKDALAAWADRMAAAPAPKAGKFVGHPTRLTGWSHKPTFDAEKKVLMFGLRVSQDKSATNPQKDEVHFLTVLYAPAGGCVAMRTRAPVKAWDKAFDETKKLAGEFTFPPAGTAATGTDGDDPTTHYAKIGGAGLVGVVLAVLAAKLVGGKSRRPAAPPRPAARRFGTPR